MSDTKTHPDVVTVSFGMSGFFAVMLTWNEDYGGFYEPFNTGIGQYDTGDKANKEAKQWADLENAKYEPAYVGITLEEAEEQARKRSELFKKRCARIKELRDTGMGFNEARAQAEKELGE